MMYQDGYSPTAYDKVILYERLFIDDDRPSIILPDGTRVFDENSAYYFHFYKWALQPTWIDQELTPHMIFGSKGYIPQLESRQFDTNTIDYLNKHGLNIYLYEVLSFTKCLIDRPIFAISKNSGLIDTLNKHYSESMLGECHQDNYTDLKCYELESINLFAKNNNLTNVNVHTCHYNIGFIQDKYPNINLFCKDLHLASMVDYPEEDVYQFQKIESVNLIEKKFISPNWRYHSARHLLMTYLIDKSGIYSWYYKSNVKGLQSNLWFNLSESKLNSVVEAGLPLLNQSAPLEINCKQEINTINGKSEYLKYPGGTQGAPGDYRMDEAYLKCFCAVVTESFFAMPTGIVSEKVLNAIKLGRPFVLVAPPRTLEYMHKLGFQTFGRYWDEEYDIESNHEQRMIKILAVLDYINSMSIDELKVWYSNMKDILDHNVSVLKSLKEPGNIL